MLAWLEDGFEKWKKSVGGAADADLEQLQRLHSGETRSLFEIATMVANHWTYHAGEINAILSTVRGQALGAG